MTDEEILKRACELKGHAWRSTGVVFCDAGGEHEKQSCQYCGKVRWRTPIEDPYTYKYHD